jgi:hypothetical protein
MCLFSSTFSLLLSIAAANRNPTGRPKWEDEVVFANRPRRRSRTDIVETTIVKQSHRPSAEYIPAPPSPKPKPIIRPATPPKALRAPSPPETIALVRVEEDRKPVPSSPPTSKSSTSVSKKSRRGSRGGEEVYIERERIRERMAPPPPSPRRSKQEYDMYVEAPSSPARYSEEERMVGRRSRSITYETNPRMSGRVVERERVVVEDRGRRREYYRRP